MKATNTLMLAGLMIAPAMPVAHADVLHNDDVIANRYCGDDTTGCVNGENFLVNGTYNAQFKAKDSEPIIYLQNTTANAADWAIDGDGNLDTAPPESFSIFNDENNSNPFIIENGAGDNLLYLDAAERIGINTNLPGVTLDAIGNRIRLRNGTKRIMMRADGTAVDLQAENADLFIRSATAGRNIVMNPFANDGNVGVGTSDPKNPLHVQKIDGTAQVKVTELATGNTLRTLFNLICEECTPSFRFQQGAPGPAALVWFFRMMQTGDFAIDYQGSSGNEFIFEQDGDLKIEGTVSQASSRELKDEIESLDGKTVLDKVAALPLSEWSYKKDNGKVRHIGPMAEDFHAAFGLGDSKKALSSIDTGGVALAAIQGLNEVMQAKDARLSAQETQLTAQAREIAELKKMVYQLAAKDKIASVTIAQ